MFSFALITLGHLCEDNPQWQVLSVAAYGTQGAPQTSGERVSQHESPEQRRSMSNDKEASRQTVHNKGTVVLFLLCGISSLLPEHSLFYSPVRALWFIYLGKEELLCVTVCSKTGVWVKVASTSQLLPWYWQQLHCKWELSLCSKVYGRSNITSICETWISIIFHNSLQTSAKSFHRILEPGCKDFIPSASPPNSIRENMNLLTLLCSQVHCHVETRPTCCPTGRSAPNKLQQRYLGSSYWYFHW